MRDLELWRALGEESLNPDALVPLLRSLVELTPDQQAPFWGRLERCLDAPDATLRAAAVGALGGALGFRGWQAMVRGLDDESPEVRAAAIAAIRRSVTADEGRWIHLAFHREPEIRRAALRDPPEGLPRSISVLLIADPECRDLAKAMAASAALDATQLAPLLDLVDQGALSAEEARPMLLGLLDRVGPRNVLATLRFALPPSEGRANPMSWLTDPANADGLDRLVYVFWHAPAEQQQELARLAFQFEADEEKELRFAWSVLRLGVLHGSWPPPLLALAAAVTPAILAETGIDLEDRKDAARRVFDFDSKIRVDDPLAPLLSSRVIRDESDGLDLEVIRGVVSRAAGHPFSLLCSHFPQRELLAAVRARPIEGLVLLQLPPPTEEREIYQTLLQAVVADASKLGGEELVPVVSQLPGEWMWLIDQIAGTRPGAILDLTTALCHQHLAGTLRIPGARKRHLIDALVPAVRRHFLPDFLSMIATTPNIAHSELAVELLHDVASSIKPKRFAKQLKAMDPAELTAFIELLGQIALFPLATLHAIVPVLSAHRNRAVKELAKAVLSPAAPGSTFSHRTPKSSKLSELSKRDLKAILAADESDLGKVLEPVYKRRVTRLVEALALRPRPVAPSVEACCALLTCYDPAPLVCEQFEKFGSDDPELLSEVDKTMVSRCTHPGAASWLGCAWLHKWEGNLFQFTDEILEAGAGGFAQLLRETLDWASPILAEQVWRAVARQCGIWRFRAAHRMVVQCTEGLGEVAVDELPRFGTVAADILIAMLRGGVDPLIMERLRERTYPLLSRIDSNTLQVLLGWFDARHAAAWPVSTAAAATPSDPDTGSLIALTDPDKLGTFLLHPSAQVVRTASERLLELGEPGRHPVIQALEHDPPPHHARIVAAAVSVWPEGARVTAARALLVQTTLSPVVRFAVGLALLKRGEMDLWPAVAAVVCESAARPWFGLGDWEALAALELSERDLAVGLAASPHSAAYAKAVHTLLSTVPADTEMIAALTAFLESDSGRLGELRRRAAERLAAHGDWRGFPILYTAAFRKKDSDAPPVDTDILSAAPEALVYDATAALEVAGLSILSGAGFLKALDADGVDPTVRDQCWVSLLKHLDSGAAHHWILTRLRPRASKAVKLERLAEAFAWGVRRSRQLSGRMLQVRMTADGALGHTRLNTSTIFVTPLPILRGERNADAVTRGLIVHEIGHHLYNSDKVSMQLSEEAAKQQLHGLLNLVQDEHLERNLRAQDEAAGADLKTLAAYAFQHADQEVEVALLLQQLGVRAAAVLPAAKLRVAKRRGRARIQIGRVLRELEANASSFARFIRALRMGLGDRFDDPKVQAGLALFDRSFRRASPGELWGITKKLHEIFGDDVKLLQMFGMHEVTAADGSETRVHGEGITEDELQDAIERILNPGHNAPPPKGPNPTQINRGIDTSFDKIATVTPVEPDPTTHRMRARAVARASRRMREYFERLGMRLEPHRGRIQGRAVDRARLQAALTRADPRLLIARSPEYRTDLFMGVLVDCSGSMTSDDNIERARLYGTLLAEAGKGLRGMDVRFWGFTDEVIYDAGDANRCAISGLVEGGGNNDAAALWHASREALRSGRRARLLVMISDGAPTECTVDALRGLVDDLTRKNNIACAQIAVRPIDDVCFPHYVEVDDVDLNAAVRQFGTVIARLVGKTLGAS